MWIFFVVFQLVFLLLILLIYEILKQCKPALVALKMSIMQRPLPDPLVGDIGYPNETVCTHRNPESISVKCIPCNMITYKLADDAVVTSLWPWQRINNIYVCVNMTLGTQF